MKTCNFSSYLASMENLKKSGQLKATNLFMDANEMRSMLEKNACSYINRSENAFFLFKPWHNNSLDIIYACTDLPALKSGLTSLPVNVRLRVSVIGKDPLSEEMADAFATAGFELRKKLLRMRCREGKRNLKNALRIFAEPYTANFGFATPAEAEEILDILLKDFDVVGDNLPLLEEIREAAAKKWIPVIRLDGQIASLHYFTLRSNILSGLYDVTREEYRGGAGLFPALKYFVDEVVPEVHPNIKRAYGWRDAKNKKLIKNAETLNQNYDGIVIYNMVREANA